MESDDFAKERDNRSYGAVGGFSSTSGKESISSFTNKSYEKKYDSLPPVYENYSVGGYSNYK